MQPILSPQISQELFDQMIEHATTEQIFQNSLTQSFANIESHKEMPPIKLEQLLAVCQSTFSGKEEEMLKLLAYKEQLDQKERLALRDPFEWMSLFSELTYDLCSRFHISVDRFECKGAEGEGGLTCLKEIIYIIQVVQSITLIQKEQLQETWIYQKKAFWEGFKQGVKKFPVRVITSLMIEQVIQILLDLLDPAVLSSNTYKNTYLKNFNVLTAILVGGIAFPIGEEIVYRGFLLGGMEYLQAKAKKFTPEIFQKTSLFQFLVSKTTRIGVSAILFGHGHLGSEHRSLKQELVHGSFTTLIGEEFAFLKEEFQTVYAPMGAHIAHNLILVNLLVITGFFGQK